jgi:hypothetical protein
MASKSLEVWPTVNFKKSEKSFSEKNVLGRYEVFAVNFKKNRKADSSTSPMKKKVLVILNTISATRLALTAAKIARYVYGLKNPTSLRKIPGERSFIF